jgi:hypothetical protein
MQEISASSVTISFLRRTLVHWVSWLFCYSTGWLYVWQPCYKCRGVKYEHKDLYGDVVKVKDITHTIHLPLCLVCVNTTRNLISLTKFRVSCKRWTVQDGAALNSSTAYTTVQILSQFSCEINNKCFFVYSDIKSFKLGIYANNI